MFEDNPILNQTQKEFLSSLLKHELSSVFYLSGGTALSAFYLFHRYSEDLDFFSEEDIPLETILSFLRTLAHIKIDYEKKFDRKIFLIHLLDKTSLKVEFTSYPFPSLEEKRKFDGLLVDSLIDITANKLTSLTDRKDPKDLIDLYFILTTYPQFNIKELIEKAERKFGISGLKYSLAGRFLEGFALEGVSLCKKVNSSTVIAFLKNLSKQIISEEI